MQGDRYDWMMVQIDEIGAAVRKLTAALLDKQTEELTVLDAQTDDLLEDAFEHSRLAMVDSRTAAVILRPPARIRAYAQLLAAKARLLHERGELGPGRALAQRALELQLEAAALEPNRDLVDHDGIDTLLDIDPPLRLSPRYHDLYRELLAGVDHDTD